MVPVLLVTLALVACGEESAAPPKLEPERCLMPVDVPEGFEAVGSDEVEQGATIGVRTFLEGTRDRSMVFTAGVLMDFFEEAPSEEVALADGREGSLFRDGKDQWILFWYQDDACKQFSIGGSGFTREEFLGQMREMDLLT
jgi:hypothetical protein